MIDAYKRFDPKSEAFKRELEAHFRSIADVLNEPMYGATAERPNLLYVPWFDTTLGKLIVNNGTDWVNVDGSAL